MDPQYRSLFNQAFSPALYSRFQVTLQRMLGPIPFRLAETPLFVTPALRRALTRSAMEIVDQLSEPTRLAKMMKVIPDRFRAPGMDPLPNFVQVDFALTPGAEGQLEGKVVELQAFPSGHAMMTFFTDAWRETFAGIPGLEGDWSCFSDVDAKAGYDIIRRTICGDTDPELVALVDFEPEKQKTVPDFVATEKLFGVQAACATRLIRKGRSLFRESNGRQIPVKRIYNRMVFDELEVKGYQLPFDFRDDLDVTWSSHPNWYWVWSKYSLPFIDHPAVPRARFLSQFETLPEDLSRYVLKPLFSFAGSGVVIDVTPEEIARVPRDQWHGWVLQEKITYAPAIRAPSGAEVKAEIRVMLLRPPDETKLEPIILLTRLSRGKMIGVDHNKGLDWQGGSVGLWRP